MRRRRPPPTANGSTRYFGNVGLFAYSLDGKPLWNVRFDPQPMYLDFGTAASPVVHEGKVFVVHDNDGKSFAAAIEARTGKQLWRVERDLPSKGMMSGWSTPFVWKHDGRTELIVIGKSYAVSYAPETGKELWRIGGLTGQSTPTPVAADGLLYLATGSQGESNRPVFAVRPGASGDITLAKGEESNQFVAWFHPRASAYTSSPLRVSRPHVCGERQRHPHGVRMRRPAKRSTRRVPADPATRSRRRRGRRTGRSIC